MDEDTSSDRQAILVLGMHRSGTSALCGIVNALGAAGPKTPLIPHDDNPKGFFESAPLMRAHEALLAAGDSHWHDWRPFDLDRISPGLIDQHRHAIGNVLRDEFGEAPLIVVKDPRICRHVLFTLSILSDLKFRTVALLPCRNPLEVALSLQKRNGFSLSKSLLLWLRHVLDAEYHSRHLPRCFLSYQRFLVDWPSEMRRAADITGIVWPDASESTHSVIREFLTDDLYHQKVSTPELTGNPAVTSLVRETYEILEQFANAGESAELLKQLDGIRLRFEEACLMFDAVADMDITVEALKKESHTNAVRVQKIEMEKNAVSAQLEHQSLELKRLIEASEEKSLSFTARVRKIEMEKNAVSAQLEHQSLELKRLIEASEGTSQGFAVKLQQLESEKQNVVALLEQKSIETATMLAEHVASRSDLKSTTTRLESEAVALATQLDRTTQDLAQQTHEVACLNSSVAGLELSVVNLQHQADALLSSRSWRLTAPLRAAVTFFRRSLRSKSEKEHRHVSD